MYVYVLNKRGKFGISIFNVPHRHCGFRIGSFIAASDLSVSYECRSNLSNYLWVEEEEEEQEEEEEEEEEFIYQKYTYT